MSTCKKVEITFSVLNLHNSFILVIKLLNQFSKTKPVHCRFGFFIIKRSEKKNTDS